MRNERWTVVRCERVVTKNVLLRHIPIRLYLALNNMGVRLKRFLVITDYKALWLIHPIVLGTALFGFVPSGDLLIEAVVLPLIVI
jgi:hypothetical protein